ncbi:acyl transferase/acyl hydrolase/lysophospholipase [Aspergillus novoparasiticus]|uniref:Acyl transferase/acyl hydrolase/lysophospholipase n=1 Tax=Aspergillus novoparasiticus TaxID=986946 RepID=A0A5N6ETY3_9EURO|nr:acyl transferase/acyl hydrolase/lysophospholipase [Aspergillus novoparasiticus]
MSSTSVLYTSQPRARRTPVDASIHCRMFVQELNAAGPYNQDIHDLITIVRDIESALRVLQLYHDEHIRTGHWNTNFTANPDNADMLAIVDSVLGEFENICFDMEFMSRSNKRTFIKHAPKSAKPLEKQKVGIFRLVEKITGFSGLSQDGGLPMPILTQKPHITCDGVRLLSIGTRFLHLYITAQLAVNLGRDGGGVRGLVSLLVLDRIMDCIRYQERQENPAASIDDRAPAKYFDLAGGTSTGGLICIMLFRLHMSVKDAIEAYKTLSNDIFKKSFASRHLGGSKVKTVLGRPWYKGQPLEKAVDKLVETKLPGQSAESTTLLDPTGTGRCKSFVCTFRKQDMETVRLRTYEPGDSRILFPYPRCTVSQAARATSAAPFYFPEAKIGHNKFWDGGLVNNNPIDETYDEKCLLFPSQMLNCVVSLGTGKCTKFMRSRNLLARHPAISRGGRILVNVTNVEAKHRRFEQRMIIDDVQYFRFDPSTMGDNIDLADVRQLEKLEKYTTDYLQTPPISALIHLCAQLLRYRGEHGHI